MGADLGTLCSSLLLLAIFCLVGGVYEGWHTWRVERQRRRKAEDWLAEGNRRIW